MTLFSAFLSFYLFFFTSNDPTAQSRDALYLCEVVLEEVLIALHAHVARHTEPFPQLTGRCEVSRYHSFRAHVKTISHQCPVP